MSDVGSKMINCPSCGLENDENASECEFCGFNLKAKSFTSQAEMDLLNRALAPKFKIYKKIGRGGMATVFLGDQVDLDRKIVVKLLSEEYSEDKDIRERFLQEARTPARIKHPNLVEVIDVGVFEDRPYYIMEYAPGGSLSDKLKNYKEQGKTFPVREALYIISRVLHALDYCHNNRLHSHRDIKPDNIMFRATGEPIITDFGIAKVAGEFRTQTRMTLGTANYMSPEQCRGAKDLDGRSDIYAVGIMLFELLTGDVPFKGESGISVMGKHVNSKLPDISLSIKDSAYKTDISSEKLMRKLEYIVKKACAKKREKRYQTAKEFAEELEQLLEEQTQGKLPVVDNGGLGLVAAVLFLGLGLGSILAYIFLLKAPDNISFVTFPPGAKVNSLDTSTEQGRSPFSVKKENPGVYKYKITLDGYEEKIVEVELSNIKQPKKVEIALEKKQEPKVDNNKPEKEPENPDDSKNPDKTILATTFSAGGLEWQSKDIKTMDWKSAVNYCKKRGMHLPTRQEFKLGFNAKKVLFKKPCCEYWTSSQRETDPEEAYNVSVDNYGEFFAHKSNPFLVRCVKR